MSDREWRAAERAWREAPHERAVCDRFVVACRRAGQPIPRELNGEDLLASLAERLQAAYEPFDGGGYVHLARLQVLPGADPATLPAEAQEALRGPNGAACSEVTGLREVEDAWWLWTGFHTGDAGWDLAKKAELDRLSREIVGALRERFPAARLFDLDARYDRDVYWTCDLAVADPVLDRTLCLQIGYSW